MEKTLACLPMVLILFLLSGCIGGSFDSEHARFAEIRGRYISGEGFLPGTEREILLMRKEVAGLKNSSGNSAVIDFLEIELAKLEMQYGIVTAREKLRGINLSDVDCRQLQEGLNKLEKAEASGRQAMRLAGDFQKNHPGEFLKVDLEKDRVRPLILSTHGNIAYVKDLKQLSC